MDSEKLLDYWFGPLEDDLDYPSDKTSLWWGKEHDGEIRRLFGSLMEQAKSGELDSWKKGPRSMRALILLLDQVTRTLHRGTPEAFAWDSEARALTDQALELGFDQELRPVERTFVYITLMHSESLDDHDRAVALYTQVVNAVPEGSDTRAALEGNLEFEHKHRDIIVRFGRYPHRNEVLGRTSTSEELAFLKEPDSSF